MTFYKKTTTTTTKNQVCCYRLNWSTPDEDAAAATSVCVIFPESPISQRDITIVNLAIGSYSVARLTIVMSCWIPTKPWLKIIIFLNYGKMMTIDHGHQTVFTMHRYDKCPQGYDELCLTTSAPRTLFMQTIAPSSRQYTWLLPCGLSSCRLPPC